MKILLLAIGTRGDAQPFIVLGASLVGRGHEVTIATAPEFAAASQAAGLAHRALPLDIHAALEGPELGGLFQNIAGLPRTYRWIRDTMNEQLSAIWEIGLDFQPDLILHHFMGAPAPYLARHLGAISAPVFLQPGFAPTARYPQFFIASRTLGPVGNRFSHALIDYGKRLGTRIMFARWRRTRGIDVGPELDITQGYDPSGRAVRIHAYSEAIVPRPDDWPESEIQTGYIFAEPADYDPPADLSAFLAEAPQPIYCGFGSMPGVDRAAIARALKGALDRTGLRAVVATGWGALGELGASNNVHVVESVPHSWLFPQVAAVVHHGGSGTTHEGLRWGRPSVICPLFIDQPFFGRRIAALGAGPEPIWQLLLTEDNLARALEIATSDPVRARAAEIGEAMKGEDGAARIGELIERGRIAPDAL